MYAVGVGLDNNFKCECRFKSVRILSHLSEWKSIEESQNNEWSEFECMTERVRRRVRI